jgi:hypothetical protein
MILPMLYTHILFIDAFSSLSSWKCPWIENFSVFSVSFISTTVKVIFSKINSCISFPITAVSGSEANTTCFTLKYFVVSNSLETWIHFCVGLCSEQVEVRRRSDHSSKDDIVLLCLQILIHWSSYHRRYTLWVSETVVKKGQTFQRLTDIFLNLICFIASPCGRAV